MYKTRQAYKGRKCCEKIDATFQRAEAELYNLWPAEGLVNQARANLFMADTYGIELAKRQRQLFLSWDKRFPPDPWEIQWATKVAAIEGYTNPYILQRG